MIANGAVIAVANVFAFVTPITELATIRANVSCPTGFAKTFAGFRIARTSVLTTTFAFAFDSVHSGRALVVASENINVCNYNMNGTIDKDKRGK